ncbi:MAG TPA: glycosyltransferase family 4 protein [Stellaceae bacterium]|nr:glycosyltransferase family 4 protein [Stellaceae bacterium]
MNILWLPHAPLRVGRARSDHLIERLAQRHHLTVLSFRIHSPDEPWRYVADLVTHRTRRGTPYDELAHWRFPRLTALNGAILNRVVARALDARRYDVLVVAPAPYITGYLDFDALKGRLPIICDYLDGMEWARDTGNSAFEPIYVRSADAVMCVSKGLLRQALTVNLRSFYVPNGVELARYRAFRAAHTTRGCKQALGLDPDAYVVSIIGMTCSPRLYFVDAIVDLVRKGRNVVLLLVGASPLLPEIMRRAGDCARAVRAVGAVPYADVLPYFMATDLGLSAVDDHPYYHLQSPLKIFEYGAMGKPVVAAPFAEEVAETDLAHVRFCDADAPSLARAIEEQMTAGASLPEPMLDDYDWDRLAAKVEWILDSARSGSACDTR